jgi:hypothetical protein
MLAASRTIRYIIWNSYTYYIVWNKFQTM